MLAYTVAILAFFKPLLIKIALYIERKGKDFKNKFHEIRQPSKKFKSLDIEKVFADRIARQPAPDWMVYRVAKHF